MRWRFNPVGVPVSTLLFSRFCVFSFESAGRCHLLYSNDSLWETCPFQLVLPTANAYFSFRFTAQFPSIYVPTLLVLPQTRAQSRNVKCFAFPSVPTVIITYIVMESFETIDMRACTGV